MDIVIMDLLYIRIGYDYEWQAAEGLDSVCDTCGQDGQGEVCRLEQRLNGKRWTAMSTIIMMVSYSLLPQILSMPYLTKSASVSGCRGFAARSAMCSSVTVTVLRHRRAGETTAVLRGLGGQKDRRN